MLFHNFSTNVEAVRDTMSDIHRCEGFAELVLEMQGIELAHRNAKIIRAYHMAVTAHAPHLLEYGLTQESQYRLRDEVTDCLSATISWEDVYKAVLVGDGQQVLAVNTRYVLKYKNGYRLAEIFEKRFQS